MPLDLDGAVDVIANGEARRIDLAEIDGDYFLNNAALGLAPVVAESVPQGLKRSLGRLGYLMWAGWSAANFKAFRLTVDDGTRAHRLWATEARIANGRFHGGVELIENAGLESGEIVVQAVEGRSIMKLGWSYAASMLKHPSRHETVREFRGKRMRIDTKPRMRVSIDGELGPETPFEARAVPQAIVAAPRLAGGIEAPARLGRCGERFLDDFLFVDRRRMGNLHSRLLPPAVQVKGNGHRHVGERADGEARHRASAFSQG